MKANDNDLNAQAWGLDLSAYGTCLAIYEGKGTLTLSTGENLDCEFQAGQLANGEVTLLCASDSYSFLPFEDSVSSFSGLTSNGYELQSQGIMTGTNYLPDRTRPGSYAAFHIGRLLVRAGEFSAVRRVHFGITNFRFAPTAAQANDRNLSVLPLSLSNKNQPINLYLKRVENYDKLVQQIQTLKGIGVTCEVVADISNDEMLASLEEVVDNLCRILSVARGTKIQWIYGAYYNDSGGFLGRMHFEHVTKAYCPMAIIGYDFGSRLDTRKFIENAYPLFLERRDPYKLDRGTIDAYLDAKAEDDYLEMRAVKLAVALERLKAVFLAQQGGLADNFLLDETLFNTLKPKLQNAVGEVLKSKGVSSSVRGEVYRNLGGLNRKSFAQLLTEFLNYIGLAVSPANLQLFIQCRNKLVHTGEFYCISASPEEREKCIPLPTPADEYYFMVNFLDRAFLRLLGYSGIYTDYRTFKSGDLLEEQSLIPRSE